ncbi:MAG TPA: M20 family metallopeptidase [Clostridia bacterium]|nr:M20 family metallopeptidase [Clostridia bacterium]
MHEKVMKAIEERREELIKDVQEMVRVNSINPGVFEKNVADVFAAQLDKAGIPFTFVEPETDRVSVLAELKGPEEGGLLFNGHLDVVPLGDLSKWTVDPWEGVIKDNRLYGRGSTDMKGAVAAFAMAMKTIKDLGIKLKKSVYLHAVADEECGGRKGSHYIVANGLMPKVDMAIVGESSTFKGELAIVRACTGITQFKLKSFGKNSHASKPYEGNNAVLNMARVLVALQDNFELDKKIIDELLPLPTIAPGTTIKGGIKTNVIPDYCEAEVDIRVVPGMTKESVKAQLDKIIADVKSAHPEVEVAYEWYEWDDATLVGPNDEIIKQAEEAVMKAVGYTPKHMKRSGTTDARFIFAAGVPVPVAFGPGDVLIGNMHGADESVGVDDLVNWSKVYANFILQVCC